MGLFNDIIKPPLVLTIICAVVTTSLVATESKTTPIIEEQKIQAANAARGKVMPGVSSFEKIEVTELPEGGIEIYKASDSSGFVVTGSARGYGGPVKVMVGIKNDGSMTGAEVLEQSETQGLGTKIMEPTFVNQFVGKDISMKDVQTIGGATVSSRAFINAVKNAYVLYGQVAGVSMDTSEPARDPLTLETIQKIFPDATEFEQLDTKLESYKVGDLGHVIVTTEPGFADDIVAAVGFDGNGAIAKITFTKLNESEGYGEQLGETAYLDKYVGKTDITDVEIISGSTVSSEAFKKLVNKTIEAFPDVKSAKPSASLAKLKEKMAAYGENTVGIGLQGAKFAVKNDNATGLVMVTEGFGGEFDVIVIVNNDGTIAEVMMGTHNETDGYGTRCEEPAYTDLYKGQSDVEGIESIGGATVTSMSFRSAVKNALKIVKGE